MLHGEFTVRTLAPDGTITSEQIVENILTKRTYHWFITLGVGWYGIDANNINEMSTFGFTPATTNTGAAFWNMHSASVSTADLTIGMMNGMNRRYDATDQIQNAAIDSVLHPFKYLCASDSAVASTITTDQIPGVILKFKTMEHTTHSHATISEVDKIGVQVDSSYTIGEANGMVRSLGFSNYTTGAKMGAHAVLATAINGATTAFTVSYKLYISF